LSRLRNEFKNGRANNKIAFLYLTYKQETSLHQLLGSVARQLVDDEMPTPKPLKDLRKKNLNTGRKEPTLQELDELLHELVADKQVFIIVDALDELKADRKKLVNHLSRVHRNIKLLFTSRLLENFEELSEGFKQIEIVAHRNDIHGYIDHVICQSRRLGKFMKLDSTLEEDIKYEVTRKSDGT
jgi:hypothetical protein